MRKNAYLCMLIAPLCRCGFANAFFQKMMKHTLLILCFSFLSAASLWAVNAPYSGYCGRKIHQNSDSTNLRWTLQNGVLTISGSGPMRGYESAAQTPWYAYRNAIQHLHIADSVSTVGSKAFAKCSLLSSVYIGNAVASIDTAAFEGCNNLRTVEWNAVNCDNFLIYDYAPFFSVASSIRDFQFGDSVRFVPAYLCMGMQKVDSLYLPAAVDSISPYAFRMMGGLQSIIVSENNPKYDSRDTCNALMHTSSNTLLLGCAATIIPAETRTIAEQAFRDVRELTEIVIPDGVRTIGREAFYGCKELATLTLPKGLRRIEEYTFTDCRSLENVLWSDSLEYIGRRGFGYCDSLMIMILPNTLQQLDEMAITNCPKLEQIYCLADTVPQIEYNSIRFGGEVWVPCPSLPDYQTDANWQIQTLNPIYDFLFTTESVNPVFGSAQILQHPGCEEKAHILAIPAEGFEFDRWAEKGSGETFSVLAEDSFYVARDLSLVAMFKQQSTDLIYFENASDDAFSVYTSGSDIIISADSDLLIRVIDAAGGCVASAAIRGEGTAVVSVSGSGVYLVNTTRGTKKVVVE